MPKFTAGPWEASPDGEGVLTTFQENPRRHIYRLCDTRIEWQSREERRANALLIAAAPGMLEMLRKLAEYQNPDDAVSIHALIAKAEGKTA